jgi:hypothetical protein
MSGYVLKAPDGTVACETDWRRGHLRPGETVAEDLGWDVPCSLSHSGAPMVVQQHHDAWRSWASIRGGVPGRFYMVTCGVRTNEGRVLRRAIVLRIAPAPAPDSRSFE